MIAYFRVHACEEARILQGRLLSCHRQHPRRWLCVSECVHVCLFVYVLLCCLLVRIRRVRTYVRYVRTYLCTLRA